MKEDQIKFIREKCIASNPDILKLEFGCQIIVMNDVRRYVVGLEPQSKYNLVFIGGSVNGRNTFTEDEYVIIGRDIRLADVLNAMSMHVPNAMSGRTLFVGDYGGFYEEMDGYNKRCNSSWNLLKDRIEDQSPETIEFIYNLLK